MQTGPNVKVTVAIPKAEVVVLLPSLMSFINHHFTDLSLLRRFLENNLGKEVLEEQLVMGKVIVDLVTKYLVQSGLDVDCCIHGKVVAKGDDLIVHVSTPSSTSSNQNNSTLSSSSSSLKASKGKLSQSNGQALVNSGNTKKTGMTTTTTTMCVNIHLHYALLDLWEDSQVIEKSIHKALEIPVKSDRAQSNLPVK